MGATRSLEVRGPAAGDQQTMAFETFPMLIVRSEGELHGRSIPLAAGELSIGRAAGNDLQLDDPFVSRHHAVVSRAGGELVIEDIGSSSGVVVNGELAIGSTVLRDGDRVRLGQVELELRRGAAPAPMPAAEAQVVRFEVDDQLGQTINNVGRDQHNNHRYELRIEPMRRRARALLRLGNALLLSALTAQLLIAVLFSSEIGDFVGSASDAIASQNTEPDLDGPPFETLLLMPVAAVVGLVGLALILTSLSMRRRARREEDQL
jgi:FHA domain